MSREREPETAAEVRKAFAEALALIDRTIAKLEARSTEAALAVADEMAKQFPGVVAHHRSDIAAFEAQLLVERRLLATLHAAEQARLDASASAWRAWEEERPEREKREKRAADGYAESICRNVRSSRLEFNKADAGSLRAIVDDPVVDPLIRADAALLLQKYGHKAPNH